MNLQFALNRPDTFVTVTPETLQDPQKIGTYRRRCDNCSKRKKGCDREYPCSGCRHLGIYCVYSNNKRKLSKEAVNTILKKEKKQTVNRDSKTFDLSSNTFDFPPEYISLHNIARDGKTERLKSYLARPDMDVDAKDSNNQTLMHIAAKDGREEMVEMLIGEFHPKINIPDSYKKTPLHLAAYKGHKPIIVKIMSQPDMDINVKDKDGCTPLHLAIEKGHLEVVKYLLDLGADINALNNKGLTPLELAVERKNFDIIKLLVEIGKCHTKDSFYRVPSLNHAFIDRPDIFEEINNEFGKTLADECKILALQGLGGMGKTQLMTRYCYLNRLKYDFIFWLTADSRSSLIDSYKKLADNLGIGNSLIKENDPEESAIGLVCSWLEKKTKWLLLLDNVNETISKELFKYLPRFRGHIILTTREPLSSKQVKIIPVDKMQEKEAISLLLSSSSIKLDHQDTFKEIVNELDRIPFAIDIARAYIANVGMSFREYLENLKEMKENNFLLEYNENDEGLYRYEHTITTVWKNSFERIQAKNSMAVQILEICAFLHPENIPISFFDKQYSVLGLSATNSTLPSTGQETVPPLRAIQKAIADLCKYNLITKGSETEEESPASDTLKIHRLIQRVNLDTMNIDRRVQLTHKIATALDSQTDFSNPYDLSVRKSMDTYLAHIYQFARLLDTSPPSEDLSRLLLRTIRYLVDNGQCYGMTKLGNISLNISEKLYGPEDQRTVEALDNLAKINDGQGNYTEAEMLYKEVLKIRKKINDPNTAISLNNLADYYRGQAKFDDAEKLLINGGDQQSELMYVYNLANIKQERGLFNEAESQYKKALEDQKVILGVNHPKVAMTMNNLAKLYREKAKYGDAEKLYGEAQTILEKGPGLKHPSMATSLHDLAELYRSQGKYAKAKKHYDDALKIQKEARGESNLEYALILRSYGTLHFDQWNYIAAEEYYKNSLKISQKALGPEHPSVAITLKHLSELYRHQKGKLQKAQENCEEALKIIEKVLGKEHIRIAGILNNLAQINRENKNYMDAESQLERAKRIQEVVLGLEHPSVAITLSNWGKLYESQENYDKAESFYRRALAIRETALGAEHPTTATSRTHLGLLYKRQEKYTKAEECLLYAYNTKKKILKDHPRTAISSCNLALLYERQGEYEKAKPLYRDSIVICENFFDPDPCEIKDIRIKGRDLDMQGDYEKAESFFKTAIDIGKSKDDERYCQKCYSISLSDLALFYKNRKRYNESRKFYEELLKVCQDVYGEAHPCCVQIEDLCSTVKK